MRSFRQRRRTDGNASARRASGSRTTPTTQPRWSLFRRTWRIFVRGEIYQLRKPRDAQGHEQQPARYAVVVQAIYLATSTWIVASTSTSARPTSYRPEV